MTKLEVGRAYTVKGSAMQLTYKGLIFGLHEFEHKDYDYSWSCEDLKQIEDKFETTNIN